MYIAIRKPFTGLGENLIVFHDDEELENWCDQVGRSTIADFEFRRLGEHVYVTTKTIVVIE